ncbi:hypothetical protein HDN1F_01470 [gamma proteobacterium HdN1]|nr:hypothetical protein HDN1F_01470 [gamma proteobacterium HdN1]
MSIPPTTSPENRRRAPRTPVRDTLFVQAIDSAQITAIGADLKTGNTVNASAYGIQVELDFEVLVDSDIMLWVKMGDHATRLMINGTVRWTSRQLGSENFLVGIELSEESAPEMQRWLHDQQILSP